MQNQEFPYRVYVRVSTDKDEQVSSVENQADICRNWLERNGFIWNEDWVAKDEGISGTLFLERAAMQHILELAKRKEIKMVVFKSISRLARDLKDSLEIRETLNAHGVRIISVEEGYDSQKAGRNDLNFELFSLFAAQYSRTLSAGVSAALAAKVRRGDHIGKIPYGYTKEGGKLIIKEEEAEVVRQIFHWYNSGWGYKKIANELNRLGVTAKIRHNWQMTSVQRMINNPTFCGDFILNKYSVIKIAGKKKQIVNPEEQWIVFRDHHPAIVTREEFEQANGKNVKIPKRRITYWNEFRGIMKCGSCGSNMVILNTHKNKDGDKIAYAYLKCSEYRRAGTVGCRNHVPIKYEEFRDFVMSQLQEKGRLVHLNLSSDYDKKRQNEISRIKKQLPLISNQKKKLLDLYLADRIEEYEFEDKRKELERESQELEGKLFSLQNQEHTDESVKNIREAFKMLEQQDQDLHHVFKVLIKEILIHHDGTIDFEYTFDLNSGGKVTPITAKKAQK